LPALSVTATVWEVVDIRTKAMIRLPAVLPEGNALDTDGTPEPAVAFDCTRAIVGGGWVVVVVEEIVVVGAGRAVVVVEVEVVEVVGGGAVVVVVDDVLVVVGDDDVVVGGCAANVATTALQLVLEVRANVATYDPVELTTPLSFAARAFPVLCRCRV
jgi:hypothetical protein